MGISLSLGLWFVVTTAAAAILTLDLARSEVVAKPMSPPPAALALLGAEGLLLVLAMVWLEASTLFSISPVLTYLLQGSLPFIAAVLGGLLAARCFVARPAGRPRRHLHSLTGLTALLIMLGASTLMVAGIEGVYLAILVVMTIGCTLIFAVRPTKIVTTQRITLVASIAMLWAGAFLLYLMVFPEQIPVGVEVTDEEAVGDPVAEWIIPLILLSAFLLGFLQRKRG